VEVGRRDTARVKLCCAYAALEFLRRSIVPATSNPTSRSIPHCESVGIACPAMSTGSEHGLKTIPHEGSPHTIQCHVPGIVAANPEFVDADPLLSGMGGDVKAAVP
jgi:hypothetical protein